MYRETKERSRKKEARVEYYYALVADAAKGIERLHYLFVSSQNFMAAGTREYTAEENSNAK